MAKRNYKRKNKRGNSSKDFKDENFRDRDENSRDQREKDQYGKPRMNDARWYMPSDFLMKQHDYAMEGILGIPFDLSDDKKASEEFPTVMRINFFHTPGDTSRDILNFADPKSAAINVAGKYLFTVLSSRNKKTTIYQPQDVSLAIFAEAELISMFAIGMRAFGVALQLNARNRAVPRVLLKAMGFDPDDFIDNLHQFQAKYNVLVQAANALKFVSNVKEFEKAWALFGNYWAEENSDMCQYYVPSFEYVGVYTENVDPDDPEKLIKTVEYEALNYPMTVTSYLNKLKKMIDNLQTSSLMNYVYPDLINYMAEEGAKPYVFSLLPDFFVTAPVYSELFNTQIHNLEIRGALNATAITQDPTRNIIETHISYVAPIPTWDVAYEVDFPYTNDPSVEDKIDALMFKTPGTVSNDNGDNTYSPGYQAAIDYIPTGLRIYYPSGEYFVGRTHWNISEFTANQWSFLIHLMSKFRSAPLLYIYDNGKFVHTIGEQNTITRLKYTDIKEIFDQGMLGLFTLNADKAFSDSKTGK